MTPAAAGRRRRRVLRRVQGVHTGQICVEVARGVGEHIVRGRAVAHCQVADGGQSITARTMPARAGPWRGRPASTASAGRTWTPAASTSSPEGRGTTEPPSRGTTPVRLLTIPALQGHPMLGVTPRTVGAPPLQQSAADASSTNWSPGSEPCLASLSARRSQPAPGLPDVWRYATSAVGRPSSTVMALREQRVPDLVF